MIHIALPLRVPVALMVVCLVFAAGAPLSAADETHPVPEGTEDPLTATSYYVFHGAAIEWVWTVRADATLADGTHIDTGSLQIIAECLTESKCAGEFTFVGGLGTATCSKSGGVVAGHMELYTGGSFDCATLDLTVSGLGACEASLSASGIKMGIHRLAGSGGGLGVCIVE